MKYFLTLLIGVLLGGAAALGLLYVNPFSGSVNAVQATADDTYFYASPATSALVLTHAGAARVPTRPDAVVELWEPAINKSALSVIELEGRDGRPAALASRVSYPDERSELLMTGVLLDDEWLVSVPGQGSLFVNSQANWWSFLKDGLIPVWYLGRPWSGPMRLDPTVGPGSDGRAIVQGASGAFAGRRGSASEHYEIRQLDNRVGPRDAVAELRLDWN